MVFESLLILGGSMCLSVNTGLVMGYLINEALDQEYTIRKAIYYYIPSIFIGAAVGYNLLNNISCQ
jgi:hypothetical protein